MPRTTSLSACLIVRNEADCLTACLSSLQGLADEIIVVDTGSTDTSPQIAAAHGARVFAYRWQDDFGAARNYALKQARSEWILSIDADETLPEASRQALSRFLASEPAPARVQVRILSFDDQGEPQSVFSIVRLFARRPEHRFLRSFHEYLEDLGQPQSPLRFEPEICLHHWGYTSQAAQGKGKIGRNQRLLQKLRLQEPENPLWIYYSANALATQNQEAAALAEFSRLIDLCMALPEYQQAYYFARGIIESMSLYRKLGQPEQGLRLAQDYQSRCQDNPDYWFCLGSLQRQLGRYDLARVCFEHCLEFCAETLQLQYAPTSLLQGPFLQLLQLERLSLYHPQSPASEQAQALKNFIHLLERAWQADQSPGWRSRLCAYAFEAGALTETEADLPQELLKALRDWEEPEFCARLQQSLEQPFASAYQELAKLCLERWPQAPWMLEGVLQAAFLRWRDARWMVLRSLPYPAAQARQILLEALMISPADALLQAMLENQGTPQQA